MSVKRCLTQGATHRWRLNAVFAPAGTGGNLMRKFMITAVYGAAISLAMLSAPCWAAPELTINPAAPCGGAVTCNGSNPFSLTTSSLDSATLPSFGHNPVQFLIENNSGMTINILTGTLTGALATTNQTWNSGTSGFNPSTNPFTLFTIDGFNSATGTPCTGGGVLLGNPGGALATAVTCRQSLSIATVRAESASRPVGSSCWSTIRLLLATC